MAETSGPVATALRQTQPANGRGGPRLAVAMQLALAAVAAAIAGRAASAQPPCTVGHPTATLSVPHLASAGVLDADPASAAWTRAAVTWITHDCSKTLEYPALKTEVRAFWTDADLYLLFICPYRDLNLFLPADTKHARSHLWDRDVVEIFLGDDWTHIRQYREFEIAPTGDWIDLAIDLDRDSHDETWRSGWQTAARIDPHARVWYAAARIPLAAIHGAADSGSAASVHPGTRWRMNLYRTDGLGADPQRHFMCWQPTCVTPDRDPNHVPENFGTLIFTQ